MGNELIRAVAAGAQDRGIEVRQVATEEDEASVDVLVALGFPHYYPDLLRRPRRTHRILWYGEPLPSPGRGLAPSVLLALPIPRMTDVATRLLPPLTQEP